MHVRKFYKICQDIILFTFFLELLEGLVYARSKPLTWKSHKAYCWKLKLTTCLLICRYLEEGNFDTVRLALERSKKVVVATLELVPDLEKHELFPLIDKLPRIDITEGTGFGANYQVNKQQAKSLVEACHVSLFETGDLIEEFTESYYPYEEGK